MRRSPMVHCLLLLTVLAASGLAAEGLAAESRPADSPSSAAPPASAIPPPPGAAAGAPAAAHPAEPTPAPGGGQAPALDAVTTRRAEQAADAYLRAQVEHDGHADPQAEHAMADAEVDLLEAQAFLDLHQPLKAGERYLEAAKLLSGITAEQGLALSGRMRKASAALTALSRSLLEDKAFDLGTPEAGGPQTHPIGPPLPNPPPAR